MCIESKRLVYSKWTMDDFDILKQTLGNPNVCQYLPGTNEKTDEEIRKWLEYYVKSFDTHHGTRIYKVSTKDTNNVIGYCGVGYVKEFDKMEIMYGLTETYWRNGYGLEMSLCMKDLAKEMGLTELIALADIDNIGSNKILLSTGFSNRKTITLWGSELYKYDLTL